MLISLAIAAGAALGILQDDGASDGSPTPNPAAVTADPAGGPVIPFPVVPPATGEGVSSVDG